MSRSVRRCVVVMLCGIMLGLPELLAGTLDEFERGESAPPPPPERPADLERPPRDVKPDDRRPPRAPQEAPKKDKGVGHSSSPALDPISAGLVELAAEASIVGLTYGGLYSVGRMVPSLGDESMRRATGELLIPVLQGDAVYQRVRGGVTAWSYRGEVGYAFLGFSAQTTVYDEDTPADELRVNAIHGLYRMSIQDFLEVDVGAGTLSMKGNREDSGFSVTLPVRFRPTDAVGLEWRPVWSTIRDNRISDNEISALIGWRYAALRAGYRWVTHGEEVLNGPIVGLSVRW